MKFIHLTEKHLSFEPNIMIRIIQIPSQPIPNWNIKKKTNYNFSFSLLGIQLSGPTNPESIPPSTSGAQLKLGQSTV